LNIGGAERNMRMTSRTEYHIIMVLQETGIIGDIRICRKISFSVSTFCLFTHKDNRRRGRCGMNDLTQNLIFYVRSGGVSSDMLMEGKRGL